VSPSSKLLSAQSERRIGKNPMPNLRLGERPNRHPRGGAAVPIEFQPHSSPANLLAIPRSPFEQFHGTVQFRLCRIGLTPPTKERTTPNAPITKNYNKHNNRLRLPRSPEARRPGQARPAQIRTSHPAPKGEKKLDLALKSGQLKGE